MRNKDTLRFIASLHVMIYGDRYTVPSRRCCIRLRLLVAGSHLHLVPPKQHAMLGKVGVSGRVFALRFEL